MLERNGGESKQGEDGDEGMEHSTWKWEAFSVSVAPQQLACGTCEDCVMSKSIILEFRYLWEL